jgi:hypothetical protein
LQCSPDFPLTLYVAKAGFELTLLLSQPPKCWDYWYVPPLLASRTLFFCCSAYSTTEMHPVPLKNFKTLYGTFGVTVLSPLYLYFACIYALPFTFGTFLIISAYQSFEHLIHCKYIFCFCFYFHSHVFYFRSTVPSRRVRECNGKG